MAGMMRTRSADEPNIRALIIENTVTVEHLYLSELAIAAHHLQKHHGHGQKRQKNQRKGVLRSGHAGIKIAQARRHEKDQSGAQNYERGVAYGYDGCDLAASIISNRMEYSRSKEVKNPRVFVGDSRRLYGMNRQFAVVADSRRWSVAVSDCISELGFTIFSAFYEKQTKAVLILHGHGHGSRDKSNLCTRGEQPIIFNSDWSRPPCSCREV
uniref:Uncharacterized protein n=1 Tax=Romanomermis culicivorax TaxID=13658 RepID=A0A915JVS9_ROMCU